MSALAAPFPIRAGNWPATLPDPASSQRDASPVADERAVRAEPIDWEAAYATYLPRVYDYFRLRTGNDSLAEELSAQTFESAWRGRVGFRGDVATLPAWLFAIARNVVASHFRRRYAVPDVRLEDAAAYPDSKDVNSPEGAAERRGELDRLRRLLAALPKRERELIELKYGGGLTNRAIARLTGLSESNVGTLVHRTVRRLRASWDGRDSEREEA